MRFSELHAICYSQIANEAGSYPVIPNPPDIDADATEEEQEAYWKALDDQNKLISQIAKKYATSKAVELKKTTSGGNLRIIVHASSKESGKFQVSRLGVDGEPWGDTVYSSMEKALADELRDGFQITKVVT